MAKGKKSKSSITPLADRVLVRLLSEEERERTTSAGIIIPETVKEDKGAKRGEVIAVGEGKIDDGKLIKPRVKKGDQVLFSWGEELTIDGEEYHLVSESNILAIVG